MSTDKETCIAGSKTRTDWNALRVRLLLPEAEAWKEAFKDYFETRLNLRYLNPIKILQEHDTTKGEGFSILAIQCSLIEFLESTAQGKNYRYISRGQVLGPHEYSSSRKFFIAFLTDRVPFSNTFNKKSADDFYAGVRCGLLHEAQTKNGWRIKARSPNGVVANIQERIVYRNNFHLALLEYINLYGVQLQADTQLQQAFIRKFDALCI